MAQRRRPGGRSSSPGSSSRGGRSKSSGSSSPRGGGRSKSSGSSSPRGGSRSKSSGSSSSGGGDKESGRRIRGTAPSAADIDKLEKFEPSEEAKRHEPSQVDARGQDKRRQVVGHSYGPSKRSQIMFFVAVAVVLVVVIGGWLTLVSLFDKPPTHFKDSAPWSTTPASAQLAAEQNAKPVSPANPCGEPGNQYPIPPQSPCAPPSKANGFQGSSAGK